MNTVKKIANFKLLAFLFGVLMIGLFLRNVDYAQLSSFLQKVGWRFVLIILVTTAAYWLSTYAWYLSFRASDIRVSISDLFVYRQIGETLAVINPTSVLAGDMAKAFMLRKHGISMEEGASSVIISRTLIAISLLMLLVLSILIYMKELVMVTGPVVQGSLIAGVIFASILVPALFISPKMYLYKCATFLRRKGVRVISAKMLAQIRKINFSLADYFVNHKGRLILAILLSCLHWLMGAAEFYLILYFLEIPVTISGAVMLEMGVMLIKVMGAFVPGQIGVEEYGNMMMLSVVGLGLSGIWLAVSVIRRARQLFWLSMGSIFFLWRYKTL